MLGETIHEEGVVLENTIMPTVITQSFDGLRTKACRISPALSISLDVPIH